MTFQAAILSFTFSQPSRVVLARFLGYASIASWLCAQLPQVFKNLSLRSCEGLALPFLVNWLFGDLTNLVGCLLTDQLPFQTYLATYFCIVDFCLLGQFFHYRSRTQRSTPPNHPHTPRYLYNSVVASPRQSLILPPSSAPPHHRSASGTSLQPTRSRAGVKRSPYTATIIGHFPPDIAVTAPTPNGGGPVDGSYQAIYEAALDVARAAERVSQRRSASRRRRLSRQNTTTSVVGMQDLDENAMTESFHSDMSGRTDSESTAPSSPNVGDPDARGRMLQATPGQTPTTTSNPTFLDSSGRGRSRKRNLDAIASPYKEAAEVEIDGLPTGVGLTQVSTHQYQPQAKRSKSRSVSLARGSGGRGGRRAAGMAFMSFGILLGLGGFSGSNLTSTSTGQVLGAAPASTTRSLWETPLRHPVLSFDKSQSVSPNSALFINTHNEPNEHPSHPPHPPDDPPSFQRIIGRISAWSCTTLYLTSRLPQIWMNFQRKSVEGLSILLFVFAFCGNVLYVASILLNPVGGDGDMSEANHYLLEALPYLLGSAGTLVFDLTIMIQSIIYGSSPPIEVPTHTNTSLDRQSHSHSVSQNRRNRRKIKHVEDGERTSLLRTSTKNTGTWSRSTGRLGLGDTIAALPTVVSRSQSHSKSRSASRSKSPHQSHNITPAAVAGGGVKSTSSPTRIG